MVGGVMSYQHELELYAQRYDSPGKLPDTLMSSLVGQKLLERESITPIEWVDEAASPQQWKQIETLINEYVMSKSVHLLLILGDLLSTLATDLYREEIEMEFRSARRQHELDAADDSDYQIDVAKSEATYG